MKKLEEKKFIIVHHSQRPADSPKFIRQRHLERGFEDIGYHYIIGNGTRKTKDGKIYKGRSEKFKGAHAISHNANSIGICLVGNFDNESPTEKQMEKLMEFLNKKIRKEKIHPDHVLGHNELPGVTKTCPGKFIDMKKIREILNRGF